MLSCRSLIILGRSQNKATHWKLSLSHLPCIGFWWYTWHLVSHQSNVFLKKYFWGFFCLYDSENSVEGGRDREGERHAAKDHRLDSNPGRLRQGLSLCTRGAHSNHCAILAPESSLQTCVFFHQRPLSIKIKATLKYCCSVAIALPAIEHVFSQQVSQSVTVCRSVSSESSPPLVCQLTTGSRPTSLTEQWNRKDAGWTAQHYVSLMHISQAN